MAASITGAEDSSCRRRCLPGILMKARIHSATISKVVSNDGQTPSAHEGVFRSGQPNSATSRGKTRLQPEEGGTFVRLKSEGKALTSLSMQTKFHRSRVVDEHCVLIQTTRQWLPVGSSCERITARRCCWIWFWVNGTHVDRAWPTRREGRRI